MNLIELSSSWLQKTDYSKSIQVRTKDVLYSFLHYFKSTDLSYSDQVSAGREEMLSIIENTIPQFDLLLNEYLDGNVVRAIEIAHELLTKINISPIESPHYYFRARDNSSGFLYSKEEMFHIPYELRHRISNQRYSVSGLPCLYLGSSTYLCWEELERPDFQTCNYCILKNVAPIFVFDICIPERINSYEDIYRTCLALACSLKCQKEHTFKLEYIVPQCLLYAITTDQRFAHDGIGIRYYSVQMLNQESPVFIIDFDTPEIVSRYINVVIPAQSPHKKGQSPLLKKMFFQSRSTSLMYRYLMNSQTSDSYYVKTIDEYGDSQFGMLENYLRMCIDIEEHASLSTKRHG